MEQTGDTKINGATAKEVVQGDHIRDANEIKSAKMKFAFHIFVYVGTQLVLILGTVFLEIVVAFEKIHGVLQLSDEISISATLSFVDFILR
jgi:hypothetical protein